MKKEKLETSVKSYFSLCLSYQAKGEENEKKNTCFNCFHFRWSAEWMPV